MKQFTINKGLITERIDGVTVFFDSDSSTMFTLNDTGSTIFDLLKRNMSKEQIIKSISTTYNVSEKKAIKDVQEFIDELQRWKILSLSSSIKKPK